MKILGFSLPFKYLKINFLQQKRLKNMAATLLFKFLSYS